MPVQTYIGFTGGQAGAELCQAQDQVGLLSEAKLTLKVDFQIWVLLEKTYN